MLNYNLSELSLIHIVSSLTWNPNIGVFPNGKFKANWQMPKVSFKIKVFAHLGVEPILHVSETST